jgi:hypothetical protein
MKWSRHGCKNVCKLVPVPKFPSTPHYRPIAARSQGVTSVRGSMVRCGRVNFIRAGS